ncbi:MAG: hypothetical protein DMF82_22450, partial [Acidobacteria bacterium]
MVRGLPCRRRPPCDLRAVSVPGGHLLPDRRLEQRAPLRYRSRHRQHLARRDAAIQGEVAPAALCRGLPAGLDTAGYRTRAFTPTRFIKDGHRIDLGGGSLTVLHVPGHTPDAIALFDEAAGLLFTGDTFY